MAIHSTKDPKCPECARKFARIASLKAHIKVHMVDESLYCIECKKIFEKTVSNCFKLQPVLHLQITIVIFLFTNKSIYLTNKIFNSH